MNRPVTAVFAALEALLVVGIGVGLPVVVLSSLWAFQYGLQIDWIVFWRAAVDVWLVGHGVDLTLQLSPATAAASGVAGADAPISVTIAALGFSVLTVLLAVRAGRAIAETPHRVMGVLVSIGAFALLSAGLAASARHELATPSFVQGIVLPTLVYAVPLVAMAEVTRRRRDAEPDPVTGWVARTVGRLPDAVRVVTAAALRIGVGSAAVLLAVSGLVVGLLLVTSYAELITLYEGAHGGFLGGLALTLGQLALLPDLVVWAASWLVGPGFALGTGSGVSPLGTTVGPLPAVPFLGALPTADLPFGFVGLLVPVVASFVVATLLRGRVHAALRRAGVDDLLRRVVVGVAAGVAAGLAVGLLAWAASGSAGPGRLVDVGPDPLLVGAFAALEVGLPAALALTVSIRRFLGHDDEGHHDDDGREDDQREDARREGARREDARREDDLRAADRDRDEVHAVGPEATGDHGDAEATPSRRRLPRLPTRASLPSLPSLPSIPSRRRREHDDDATGPIDVVATPPEPTGTGRGARGDDGDATEQIDGLTR